MSIQAVGWVLGQKADDLPGTARLVLISLANHADHESGHCFNSVGLVAREAGCSERTASRYIYALCRNGFVDVRRSRKEGRFRSNDFWIIFDRKSAPWQYFNRDGFDGEPQDIEPDANLADGENTSNGLAEDVEIPEDSPQLADGPSANDGVTHKMLQPSYIQPSPTELVEGQGVPVVPPAEPPAQALVQPGRLQAAFAGSKPKGFDPKARHREQQALQEAEAARRKGQRVFVIEGTPAWRAWCATKPQGFPTTVVEGKSGWWFPLLFPPPAKGPGDRTTSPNTPASPENEPDLSELSREMGG